MPQKTEDSDIIKLQKYNLWRRGHAEELHISPDEIGRVIDNVCKLAEDAIELLSEIMHDEVNSQDEAEKFLRAYSPNTLFN